jgi:fructose-1-phosphate kinase PfkB-like protein
MIRLVHEQGGNVLLDTSGEPLRLALAQRPDIVKPNLRELEQLTGRTLGGLAEIGEAASELIAQGTGLVVVSMGGRGALFAMGEERILAVPPSVAVQSTVGAGDTMVAGLVRARATSRNLSDTARLATACGAHAVTRIESGVDPAAIRELQERVVVDDLRV